MSLQKYQASHSNNSDMEGIKFLSDITKPTTTNYIYIYGERERERERDNDEIIRTLINILNNFLALNARTLSEF